MKLRTNNGWMELDGRTVCEKNGTDFASGDNRKVWWDGEIMWFDQLGLGLRIW